MEATDFSTQGGSTDSTFLHFKIVSCDLVGCDLTPLSLDVFAGLDVH
jgi:hypothetical protein